MSVPERGSYCPKTEVSVPERNGITQDRGISSRKKNAPQLVQDAVPEKKRSYKITNQFQIMRSSKRILQKS